ncbi:hypothetical protein [Bdellovibrio svalbardensis]|uniref:Uncharacterized protein n=1 Tax=Bdellovibrio svalbardensis TaxID=2972972 RepID=A0ABT6DEZ5_9BACT|nr:hypothetical protein [Bdellovibrio svalbardensis]MDG0815415.1 hypothetical protein [Bdellovibrio svalbardensis]
MDTQMFQGKIGEISNALKSQFANLNLSDDEIKKAMSSPDDLINLICERTGISHEEASKRVHTMMSSLNISDETAKGWMAKLSETVEHKYDEIKNKFTHH